MSLGYIRADRAKEMIDEALEGARKSLAFWETCVDIPDFLQSLSEEKQQELWNWVMTWAEIKIQSKEDLPLDTVVTVSGSDGWQGETSFELFERGEDDDAQYGHAIQKSLNTAAR